MPVTAVITQSNYIPWRGYFDMLSRADEVVLLDCVQYTRRDWRNRNQIKAPTRKVWLTIPVQVKGNYFQAIDETRIIEPQWARKHRRSIEAAYSRAAHFDAVAEWLFGLLGEVSAESMLTTVNEKLIRGICNQLGINSRIRRSSDIVDRNTLRSMGPTERLVLIAQAVGAKRYLSGPSARNYLAVDRFDAAEIEVAWMNYDGYCQYPQLWGAFDPRVSVVDLLLNVGFEAASDLVRGRT